MTAKTRLVEIERWGRVSTGFRRNRRDVQVIAQRWAYVRSGQFFEVMGRNRTRMDALLEEHFAVTFGDEIFSAEGGAESAGSDG